MQAIAFFTAQGIEEQAKDGVSCYVALQFCHADTIPSIGA